MLKENLIDQVNLWRARAGALLITIMFMLYYESMRSKYG